MKFKYASILLWFILLSSKCKENNELGIHYEQASETVRKEYSLYYDLNLPFEILLNDVIVVNNVDTGMDGPDQLNQFIHENGEQKIKIRLTHPFVKNGGMIKPKDLTLIDDKLRIYLKDESVNDGKTQLIKALKFPVITHEVPYLESEWVFNAEVPFQLKGWKNSKDLRTIDHKELKKKVFAKFEDLRKLLNAGNSNDFMKELEFRNTEFYSASYFSPSQILAHEENLTATFDKFKNNMLPLEPYTMRILGDGKVVSLERIGKYEGQGVLVAEDKETKTLYTNYVLLHIPSGKNAFEIVRMNSLITSIDDE
ncbi:hypothetical protein [Cellulophaga sp. Z1A5H]|uniref:hypothetical protein n=1 Tax=Cellulophaga sp. Z1A5H TaxID=2687291 RepID=UPI0013FDAB4D|nr:hypothetical protein [Cellulophaga sp. Z1A5H]